MKKSTKSIVTVLTLVAVVAVVVGASFLYKFLYEKYKSGKNLVVDNSAEEFAAVTSSDGAQPSEESAQPPEESAKPPEESAKPDETASRGQAGEKREKAPDFTVYDADGKPVRLSDFRGTPVVLNFWASWCPPCKAEMPDFDAAYKSHPELQFMMVNLTGGRETVGTAGDFVREKGFTFPVFFDTEQQAGYAYGASSIPRTFFIARDGSIAAHAIGMIDAETLEKGIALISSP